LMCDDGGDAMLRLMCDDGGDAMLRLMCDDGGDAMLRLTCLRLMRRDVCEQIRRVGVGEHFRCPQVLRSVQVLLAEV
jgi:hypothetical protein